MNTYRFGWWRSWRWRRCSRLAAGRIQHEVPGDGHDAEFPPFELRGEADGSEIVGFDVEVAQAIAAQVGLPLKIEDMAFDSLLPALATGKVDWCSPA